MRDLVKPTLEILYASIFLYRQGHSQIEPFGPVKITCGLLVSRVAPGNNHFGVFQLKVEAEPAGYVANQADRYRALFASEAIINDPCEGRLARTTLAGDYVNFAGDESNHARIEL